ncbi:MAG: bifunctional (p)ppGpp synthetase/guanosine-3',5'-bis(diphosphate) 3'-pyrophosphohydrolase [Candidatus Nealsonbacteria bacterium]|nr:bifunctional (p)ppGpp synthetase/guanosine-3',5'-bis(diphosphate) 3'-pyrophosphohydrolase [Candidatus Nealsonbacteria bacterium]
MSGLGLIDRAREFAEKKHAGQFREHKAHLLPFIIHPQEVAKIVSDSGGSDEEIATAWLHDLVEDTSTTLAEIEKLFGSEVAKIVDGVTDPPDFKGLPLLIRKARQAERVRSESASIKRVKLADQIVNVRSLADPPVSWSKQKCLDYIEGARLVAGECSEVDDYLASQFELTYIEAIESFSPEETFDQI